MATKHEWDYPGKPLKKGDTGAAVRYAQEWLNLHGFGCAIDGEFGPATEAAVTHFQNYKMTSFAERGFIGTQTWYELAEPITDAISLQAISGAKFSETIVAFAQFHLTRHPREVGGQNRGPWVRLYTGGHEGVSYPWCAAFATYVFKQAVRACKVTAPIPGSLSCDELARQAAKVKRFKIEKPKPSPGDLFLIPRPGGGGYQHTGIVISIDAGKGTFWTVEGNTNDDGSREGYEVCKRVRIISKCVFIKMS